ncbi:MAG: phage tail protein [Alphaproteobacteria bacterium]|nr:phage tail protein [Alphaproteobacteria bacterium]
MDAFLGQIISVGFNFAPQGWALCDGSLLQISQYEALFNLLGTTYGGNGQTNFALPDLRGRVVVNQGQGPGLSDYALGVNGGAENVTLRSSQIGAHNHPMMATLLPNPLPPPPAPQPAADPGNGTSVLTENTQLAVSMYNAGPPDVTLSPSSISPTTYPGLPHENRQPFLAINYIICVDGIYPSQG